MKRVILGGALFLAFFVAMQFPSVAEPIGVLRYLLDHKPYDQYQGTVEDLGEPSVNAYRFKLSDLSFWNWEDDGGRYHYRFVNVGDERIFVHSSFLQRHIGLRHLILDPGEATEFRLHSTSPTVVGDTYRITVGTRCSWAALPASAVAVLVVPEEL